MSSDLESELAETLKAVAACGAGYGLAAGQACAKGAKPILMWEDWYRNSRTSRNATQLLDGTTAAVREAIAYISLGLGRAAVTAIRLQVDLLLSYTFFRDHPIEWRQVCETGRGFMLKSEIIDYHKSIRPDFESKLRLIEDVSGECLDDNYKILSAHIHGQSTFTTPKAAKLHDLIVSKEWLNSVSELQRKTAVAVANFLLAVHSHEWHNLPLYLRQESESLLRADPKKSARFFGGQ